MPHIDCHGLSLPIRDIAYRRVNRLTGWKTASAPFARPSFPIPFDTIQSPARVSFEIADDAIRKPHSAHNAVHVSRADVRRHEIPPAKCANLAQSSQDQLCPSQVQLVGSLEHSFSNVGLQRSRGLAIASAMLSTGPVNPAARVPWNARAVTVESEKVGQCS